MATRVPTELVDAITAAALANPRAGATKIHRQIVGDSGGASVRTVGTLIARARKMAPEERTNYELAKWPTSFGTDELPWAAGAAVAELSRHLGRAPSRRVAVWYYRLSLAAPSLTRQERSEAAARLAHLAEVDDRTGLESLGERLVRDAVLPEPLTEGQIRFYADFFSAMNRSSPIDAAGYAVQREKERDEALEAFVNEKSRGKTR